MKFVTTIRPVENPELAARTLAEATNLTLAEARMRLVREPPAMLAMLEEEKADALARKLCESGLPAISMDVHVPSDKDRTIARSIEFTGDQVAFSPRFGEAMQVPWAEVRMVLRGARDFHSSEETTQKVRKLSMGTAILSGGLVTSITSKVKVQSTDVSIEHLILVYARDGRSVLVGDDQVDFSCLGKAMQPSSTANIAELARLIRVKAVHAFYDERLLRLGRRPLPFVFSSESSAWTSGGAVVRSDTKPSLDVLAEALWQAVSGGLLP